MTHRTHQNRFTDLAEDLAFPSPSTSELIARCDALRASMADDLRDSRPDAWFLIAEMFGDQLEENPGRMGLGEWNDLLWAQEATQIRAQPVAPARKALPRY